jgi:two-component system CheB/CheR fusion protein
MSKKIKDSPSATVQDFPIVGVGASAGGLEAFKQFIKAIPEFSGMAYVLVQHLHPTHDSILTEILSKSTTIPVLEITDDIHLAPNHVYVIPENKILTSIDGVLKLSERGKEAKNAIIDIFFTSLAEVHLELAIGVILSGTGKDGTQGLKAIKKHGGITFAQDLQSAAFGQMPLNAINEKVVDFVLPASEIPAKLQDIFSSKSEQDENLLKDEESIYREINMLLCKLSGVDFTYYKQSTIRRRIARRITMSKSESLAAYLTHLNEDKTASSILFNDLLIPVTSFFRDPKVFKEITETVFPALLNRKSISNSIRIWVAGCSTGEEAYSLAIILNEFLGENVNGTQIKIFASDISEVSIIKARQGFYKNTQLANMPEAYLKKYFTKKDAGYQIKRQIRDLCVFAVHNFLKDPPFAKMDFITCRNVLIYMDVFLQKKVLSTFHYALVDEGFLLLGKSETTAQVSDLFSPCLNTLKIFIRKSAFGRFLDQAIRQNGESRCDNKIKLPTKELTKTDFVKSAQALLLSDYSPASVVINEHMDIVHVNGTVSPFLQLAQGVPTFNVLKIAKEGLLFELRNALLKAKQSLAIVKKEAIPIKFGDGIIDVSIEVRPLTDITEPYMLILFYKSPVKIINADNNIPNDLAVANLLRISMLEKELLQTRADVNAIAEEQEASNEELQSTNEELLSGSEELQSLNEELETSKEELQSINEELIIVNEEMLDKQKQTDISKYYIEAIIATLREPIVVLDMDLRIQNINRAFATKYNIVKNEALGKLIYEIHNYLFDNLMMCSMLEKILPEKTQIEDYEILVNLQPYGERTLLLNARQIRNEKDMEELILLAIEDITERRVIEKHLQMLSDGFETKVTERTAELELSNIELEASIEDLHNANMRLQQFAYIASHDLQEPLRKILMFISILQQQYDKLPTDVVALLTKINSSSDRMKMLIHDLLAYSYLSNDDNLFLDTDLNVVLNNILIDFELMIEQKNVQIIKTELPVINAIPLQMNQLFYNLMSNALKFSDNKAKPVIDITATELTALQLEKYPELDKKLSWCEIIFKDNGIGFDQKYEKQIFTIFQRLHSTEEYKGTGIGLSISSKIIENHGGIIFANSKINEGTSFHIILPINNGKV